MLRVKDVEKLIDRDRNTILRWEREGKIPPAQKDSRGWRFYTEQDLENMKIYLRKSSPYWEQSEQYMHN
jgi:DNA-binding transcriptional MerR regulator